MRKLTCCKRMKDAQRPGSWPHVLYVSDWQRGWLLHGAPFKYCPWCGKKVQK